MISENEQRLSTHVSMFGSDGYPIRKYGRKWFVVEFMGVRGCPLAFNTKRQAQEQFERWIEITVMRINGLIP